MMISYYFCNNSSSLQPEVAGALLQVFIAETNIVSVN